MRKLRLILFVLLSGGTLFANPSCGDLVISSVKSGLLSFVSGSVTTTINSSQLGTLINSNQSSTTGT